MHAGRTLTRITDMDRKPKRRYDWSLNSTGNRILYSVLGAIAINVVTGTWLGWVVGLAFFAVTSVIASTRR